MTTSRPLAGPGRSAVITGLMALAALGAPTVSACDSSEPEPPSLTSLFRDYVESTDVKNDPYPAEGGSVADRKAAFAAQGDPQQLLNRLLSAYPCHTAEDKRCPHSDGTFYRRNVLVKHGDGTLEVIALYVTDRPGRRDLLTDSSDRTYTGGLEDFRRHNDLLDSDDMMLAPTDLTNTKGGKLTVVSGHTDDDPSRAWLIGGAVTLGGLVLVGVAARFVALREEAREASEAREGAGAEPAGAESEGTESEGRETAGDPRAADPRERNPAASEE
ncbi:hypothetical protein [Streptomyces sp. G45]|uniref:hypothetical protein n=1 Tax=Streptomyces sp. G45 TaxID=3406627 RepID=UPI003C202175